MRLLSPRRAGARVNMLPGGPHSGGFLLRFCVYSREMPLPSSLMQALHSGIAFVGVCAMSLYVMSNGPKVAEFFEL